MRFPASGRTLLDMLSNSPATGAVLRSMREGAGIQITDLAWRSGIPATKLTRYEAGMLALSPTDAAHVTRALDLLIAKAAS